MKVHSITLCCVLLLVCGCAKPPQPSDQISLWHWMTDSHEALLDLAKQYHQETGIKVTVRLLAPSDSYSQMIIAAAQAKALPEIFGILNTKSMVADFVKAGLVADLSHEFKGGWSDELVDKALIDRKFDAGNGYGVNPGIYAVPITVTNVQMVYNKKLLAKAGVLKPPATFEEFIKDALALKRVGITPFVSGWGELWLIECFAMNYAFNVMGEQAVFATFRGERKYTDIAWIKVFNIFSQLKDMGLLMDGIVIKGNKYAEQDFALERAAFAFNGSWCINVYHDMNSRLEYGVMLPPSIQSTGYPLKIWGGAGASLVVNAQSVNQDKAIAFLKWLTAKRQQVAFARRTNNLPANKEALREVLSGASGVLEKFAQGMEASTHPTVWPVNEHPQVLEAFNKGIQAILIGDKTPEEVALAVEQVKDRVKAQRK